MKFNEESILTLFLVLGLLPSVLNLFFNVILNKNFLKEVKLQNTMSSHRRTSNVRYSGLLKKRRSRNQSCKNSIKMSENFQEKSNEKGQIIKKSRIMNAKIGKQHYTIINGRTSRTIGKVGYAVTRQLIGHGRSVYIVSRVNTD